MTTPDPLHVVVGGRSPEKMSSATAVLESHGFEATGTSSEDEARRAIAEEEQLLAVVAAPTSDPPDLRDGERPEEPGSP